jgi:hypothetical protein
MKKPLTIDQQADMLVSKGLSISDDGRQEGVFA